MPLIIYDCEFIMPKNYVCYKPVNFSHISNREFFVPGCKSISHRVLILSLACMKRLCISNLNPGEDVLATRKAIENLGVDCLDYENNLRVDPKPYFDFLQNEDSKFIKVDMANSGTSARILMGYFSSISNLTVQMRGDQSLSRRPMKRMELPLNLMGADIELYDRNNKLCLPALIKGCELKGVTYDLPMASAQVKSGILVAALNAKTPTTVTEPYLSRDHTENILKYFGVHIQRIGLQTIVYPYQQKICDEDRYEQVYVPGDASSAAFWCVLGLIIPGSKIVIKNVNGNLFRLKYIGVLQKMGGNITVSKVGTTLGEDLVDIQVESSLLKGVETDSDMASSLMDEYPILSVAAFFASGTTIFKGLKELRVKESDRLTKIKELLNLFGGQCQIKNDDLVIQVTKDNTSKNKVINNVKFDAVHDHRLSMSALILATGLQQEICLTDAEYINTSFPSFLEQFS
ncbi:MAG: 3-phosphoshikimate 1-carboxyvinyltransferase [Candidatus Puniceispirillum sp.]|nr:3-phosphoshikimate 1-carboxyvinyltransferase [Candidatus Pelagibacter sp.]MBA4282843.1 3-phosphoshikimate 1-carboxyvinyltransferase [Candidatus Puniceispirillum sp.]